MSANECTKTLRESPNNTCRYNDLSRIGIWVDFQAVCSRVKLQKWWLLKLQTNFSERPTFSKNVASLGTSPTFKPCCLPFLAQVLVSIVHGTDGILPPSHVIFVSFLGVLTILDPALCMEDFECLNCSSRIKRRQNVIAILIFIRGIDVEEWVSIQKFFRMSHFLPVVPSNSGLDFSWCFFVV